MQFQSPGTAISSSLITTPDVHQEYESSEDSYESAWDSDFDEEEDSLLDSTLCSSLPEQDISLFYK